ncbi:MAG: hypothetical protein WC979_00905 [Candidatus Pacearchaeota archaeon]|jgi:hypothetical protein|nr:hypothetical protein [Clostridia bacterium]
MEPISNVEMTKQTQETLKAKLEKLKYIKHRLDAAKKANNKTRTMIASLDYRMCQLDIEKYKVKLQKLKIESENGKQ